MLSLLPDLAPRDSHSLWYTSSRNPLHAAGVHDHHHHSAAGAHDHTAASHAANHRRGALLVERSPLARLRADEQNLDRRRHNVTSYGSTWLKPPGIPKTLHQLREERREAEEHQEALRREQLAQELAEAEAQGTAGGDGVVDAPGAEGAMDDVQLDGARDLDQDVPEGDDFDLDGDEDEDDDEDEDEEDEEDERHGEADDDDEDVTGGRAAREQEQLMAQRMRVADALRAGHAGAGDFYGAEEEIDDEDQAQMIEEDDLGGGGGNGLDMDMDADLDAEVPEGIESDDDGYEHTDTEADVTSDDEGVSRGDVSFAHAATRAPQRARFRTSMARSDVTQNSVAISDLLSRDGSSFMDSSPQMPRHSFGGAGGGAGGSGAGGPPRRPFG